MMGTVVVDDAHRKEARAKLTGSPAPIVGAPPAEFDARTAWPSCSSFVGGIRDQSDCGCCALGAFPSSPACVGAGTRLGGRPRERVACLVAGKRLGGRPWERVVCAGAGNRLGGRPRVRVVCAGAGNRPRGTSLGAWPHPLRSLRPSSAPPRLGVRRHRGCERSHVHQEWLHQDSLRAGHVFLLQQPPGLRLGRLQRRLPRGRVELPPGTLEGGETRGRSIALSDVPFCHTPTRYLKRLCPSLLPSLPIPLPSSCPFPYPPHYNEDARPRDGQGL